MNIDHYGGETGHDRSYFTGSIPGVKNGSVWNFATTYTRSLITMSKRKKRKKRKRKDIQNMKVMTERFFKFQCRICCNSPAVEVNFGFKRADEEARG